MAERVLDWVSRHDPASLNYGIREQIGTTVEDKPKTWRAGAVLDQGREGACVGFGWTGELLAAPQPNYKATAEVGNAYALDVYHKAQEIDRSEGNNWTDGASVLSGAKALIRHGFMGSYNWAFGIDDVRDAIITKGPVVIGIPWLYDMYETDASGLVKVGGKTVGGHCILLHGYHPAMRIKGETSSQRFRVFRWRNSWGDAYGVKGEGFIRYEDLRDLLKGQGEACVPMDRRRVDLSEKI